jgi:hypothetical protein
VFNVVLGFYYFVALGVPRVHTNYFSFTACTGTHSPESLRAVVRTWCSQNVYVEFTIGSKTRVRCTIANCLSLTREYTRK